MAKYTQAELETRYNKLPDILQDAMFNYDIASKIFETGKQFGLTVEKIGFLAEETGLVVLGLTRPDEFTQHLAERLEVDTEKARSIASAVNHRVFFPLREALKTTHQVEVNEEAIQKNFVILKKPAPPQVTTTPPPQVIPKPAPKPSEPLSPQTKLTPVNAPQPSLPPPSLKPLAEKPTTSIPTPPFKSPAEKTALLLSPLPAAPKIEPLDLRLQQKRPPAPPPRPEPMGGSIFGAPSIVNLAPKPPLPPQPLTPKPPTPKLTPGYDPYKEPIE